MTLPPGGFTLVPDGLDALAHELVLLAAEIAQHADRARSAAHTLGQALGGDAGSAAAAAATAWATLEELLAGRTRTVSDLLRAAVTAYVAEDLALAAGVGRRRPR